MEANVSNENGNAGVIMMAFLLGAIAGAATALLWAPQSGEETRRLIADRAREGKEKAAEAAQRSREFIERQREHLAGAVERGKEAYQRARGTEEPA
jgi:gas vesicle protein